MSPAERLPPLYAAKSAPPEPAVPPATEVEADAEPPFATLPDISERDLQADTLAFERVGRRGPRSMGWVKLALVLVVLGGAGAGAWKMWGADLMRPAGDEIPVVRAADGPFKVRPDNPGGAEIRDRDKQVYELLEPGKKGAERPAETTLRPRPEAPLPPPVAAQPMTPEAAAAASEEGSPQMVEGPGSEEDEDETAMAPVEAAPPTVGSPPPERVIAAQRPVPPPAPPAVKSETTAAVPAATEIPARAFKIQLGAVRSEAAARSEWSRLQKQHQPVLGRLALNVERADLGTKGVYFRIQAGPFADRAAADAACQELTKQKVPCLPIRPES
jgi:cell division septation protein DedD